MANIDNYLEQRVQILQNVAGLVNKAIDLDKDVMIIGTGSRVEIWDLDRWDQYNNEISESQVLEVMNLYEI